VFNKIDQLSLDRQPLRIEDDFEIEGVQTPRIFVSAKSLDGISVLRQRLAHLATISPESDGADA
jgi:GTP-binding protein HflX